MGATGIKITDNGAEVLRAKGAAVERVLKAIGPHVLLCKQRWIAAAERIVQKNAFCL